MAEKKSRGAIRSIILAVLVLLALFGMKENAEAAEAMTISSGTTKLSANKTVSSLTMTGGTLDLNGYSLTVQGSVSQKGGTVRLNRGEMVVNGDYIQEQGYSSELKIRYTNDSLIIKGNFATYSTTPQYLEEGIMKVGGDFIIGEGHSQNFYANYEETLKVVLTGTGSHKIEIPKDSASGFGKLEVESGKIVSNRLRVEALLSDLIITVQNANNDFELSKCELNGKSVTVNGNAVIYDGNTVNVNRGHLTVTGNLVQQGGTLNLNNGKVTINGNYTQKEGYASSLRLTNISEVLTIGKNFATYSTSVQYPEAGTMKVGGDFIIGVGNIKNFYANYDNTLKVILTGTGNHKVVRHEDSVSGFAYLEVESGKLTTDFLWVEKELQSNLNITLPSGSSVVNLATTNLNGKTVTVNGDARTYNTHSVDVNGGKLNVTGNLIQEGGTLKLNMGQAVIGGNFTQADTFSSSIVMNKEKDVLSVGKNYVTNSTASNTLSYGTLKVGGNLTQGSGSENNFRVDAYYPITMKMTGTAAHTSVYKSSGVYGNLSVDSKKLTTSGYFSANLQSNLVITIATGKSLELGNVNLNGHNLTINGDFVLTGNLDVNKGKLTVTGNLKQQGGNLNLNQGSALIKGNYTQVVDYGSVLVMSSNNEVLDIDGSFTTGSTLYNTLTAGSMYVGGNFAQSGGREDCFYAEGTHMLILDGAGVQNVTVNGSNSRINIMVINKSLYKGYVLNPAGCYSKFYTTDIRDFVARLYTTCLGRDYELGGLIYWSSMLAARETTGAYAGYGFVFSDEYSAKNTSDDEFLTMLYRVFMNREPDDAGMNFWKGNLASGVMNRELVYKGFSESPEYTKICEDSGIERGTVVIKEDGVAAFVKRCYTQALGREAEQGGLDYWTQALKSGSVTAEFVAGEGFIYSQEFINKNLSNDDYIRVLYRTFFGREADDGGLAFWNNHMNSGGTREDTLHFFVNSEEFHAIMAEYGL